MYYVPVLVFSAARARATSFMRIIPACRRQPRVVSNTTFLLRPLLKSTNLEVGAVFAAGMSPPSSTGVLALDFDNTLVTDAPGQSFLDWVTRVAEEAGEHPPKYKGIKDICVFQNQSFSLLHRRGKTVEDLVEDILRQADFKRETPGMKSLLKAVREKLGMKVVVVSDNNSLIVSHVLSRLDLGRHVDAIFTNSADVDRASGLVTVAPHHAAGVHDCPHSFANLCKAKIVADLGVSGLVAFAGDNVNDLCPALSVLKKGDLVLPRSGYPLESLLAKHAADLKCAVRPWKTGEDILAEIILRLNKADNFIN